MEFDFKSGFFQDRAFIPYLIRPGKKILYERTVSIISVYHEFFEYIVYVVIDVYTVGFRRFYKAVQDSARFSASL